MRSLRIPRLGHWQRVLLTLVAMLMFGIASIVEAAPGPLKMLPLKVAEDRKQAVVSVPAGYGMVSLQQFEPGAGWKRIAAKTARQGKLKFPLPAAPKGTRWRALGRVDVKVTSPGKFPAAFLKGNHRFGPIKTTQAGGGFFPGTSMLPGDFSRDFVQDGISPPDEEPVEADIWKIEGNIIYFFNQLRGLQVLDISNPADPRLIASLRLPALGQDLYLLPGGTATDQSVVLLTRGQSKDGGERTRIQLVRVTPGGAEITATRSVRGSLADSRMIGKRLILGTTEWLWADDGDNETNTYLTEWLLAAGQDPKPISETRIRGTYPIISAGAEWLAVSVFPPNRWDVSDVSVFGIQATGLVRLTERPLRTAGVIGDSFKLQWRDDVLTTISEKQSQSTQWSPVTVLENFRVPGPGGTTPSLVPGGPGLLGSLELANGESLFATRFAGDKAYVVTFFQTDPLWIVDLADPARPVVAGHLEVPGWSTHLEPIGDLLFSVGWESNTVAASLFDVADPAHPALLRRINLGAPGSYSEAAWDEKALKVIASEGLAMIPLSSYDSETHTSSSSVQLLDIDIAGRDLHQRGAIRHEFDARRSSLVKDSVISISQRVLVTAGIANRDAPEILAEVSLAWPVDRVLDAGSHMLQIESGNSYGYGRATLRVSDAFHPEQIVGETELGAGVVRSVELRDGMLYVLRETNSSPYYKYSYVSPVTGELPGKVFLDVYDASALPAVAQMGSTQLALPKGLTVTPRGLLWPRPDRPVAVLDAVPTFNFWRGGPIFIDSPVASLKTALAPRLSRPASLQADHFPFWRRPIAPRVLVFDVTDPTTPRAVASAAIGTEETIPNGVIEAADGLLVIGAGDWKNEFNGVSYPYGTAAQSVHVIEIPAKGSPIVRPGIDLPGELIAVTDLDHRGFLAFTRTLPDGEDPAIHASACDGYDAYEISALHESADALAAAGRQLFLVKSNRIIRHRLNSDGTWSALPQLSVGWRPDTLRVVNEVLIGNNWHRIFAVSTTDITAGKSWVFPTWGLDAQRIGVANNGDLLVPFGDYGAERLKR